jgi:hypothetical protein
VERYGGLIAIDSLCCSKFFEVFVLLNLSFLGSDISLAHSTNSFRHAAEYVPFYFSLAAPLILLVAVPFGFILVFVVGFLVNAIVGDSDNVPLEVTVNWTAGREK